MKRTCIATAAAVASLMALNAGTASAGNIYTGGARGAYNGDFCPRLAEGLAKAKFSYNCTPTDGSTENLQKVGQKPTDIGYAQFDVFALDAAKKQPAQPYRLIRSDLTRECLFMVTRNKNLTNFGDVALQADSLRFILPPEGSGSAATFEFLRGIDPDGLGRASDVTHAETTDLAIQSALEDESSVALFVQFPDPGNDRFKRIAESEGLFVPIIDRNILRQESNGQKVYFAEETEVRNAKFWKKGEAVVTACTPMVLFTGNPDILNDSNEKLDHADLIRTIESIPLDQLQPKTGWLANTWAKTRALSAEAVEKMVEVTEQAREKAVPYVESAKQKAHELGERASPYVEHAKEKALELGEKARPMYEQARKKAKELGDKAAPLYEQAKEKAKELGGKAMDKAKELGDTARERLQQ